MGWDRERQRLRLFCSQAQPLSTGKLDRQTEQRIFLTYAWGPFWLILGVIFGPPVLYLCLIACIAPIIILPLVFGYRMLRHSDETARAFVICLAIILVGGAASLALGL